MPDGREDYARNYYLWHLVAIGVLTVEDMDADELAANTCPEIDEVIWDEADFEDDRNVKIALIDMGVGRHHPNLEPKDGGDDTQTSRIVWEEALDLASHKHGARYVPPPANNRHRENRVQHLNTILGNAALMTSIAATVGELDILNQLAGGFGVERYVEVYDQSYPTHGTACAGLLCGTSFNDDQFGFTGNPIVYYGVDPHSRIVPITTSISPDPEQLIAAFLYAHSCNVDAILFPRDAANPLKMPKYPFLDDNEKTRLHNSDRITLAWELFEKVLVAVSQDIPVICAAGNEGHSELIYPASLAAVEANGIIAVGSVSYRGYRSGYSNYGPGLTVVAPSDDGEVYNRHQLRLDKRAEYATDVWTDGVHQHPNIPEIDFSAERLITLDVPGPRGYVAGSRDGSPINRAEAVDDPGGLYTDIGGTSGSSAIVAGVVALMQRQSAARIGGPAIKQSLLDMGGPNTDISYWYWLGGNPTNLRLDAINGGAPNAISLFGGGGLINARALLGL